MQKYCKNCGQTNSAQAQFCRFCAASLPPDNFGGQAQNFNFGQQQQFAANNFTQSAGASGRAVAALILTACGFLLCCVLASVPGAILGWTEMQAIKENRSSPRGMWMAQTALWGGIALTVLNLLFYGFYLLAAMSAGTRY
jgi:hypothetical protein